MRVLCLPGFYGTGELFAPLCAAFSAQFDVEVVRYHTERRLDEYVESVTALLPDRDAVLIAESFSGPIALAVIARNPERFRCAVLSATFAVSPYRALTRLARYLPAALFAPNRLTEAALKRRCLDADPDQDLANAAQRVLRAIPAWQIKARLELLSAVDVRYLLPQVNCPVLYLQAARDKVVGAHLGRQLAGGLSQVEVQRIDGPHFLLQSRPRECAQAIEAFVAQCRWRRGN